MDPIADMLNSIRNAQAVLHPTVSVPFSDLKYEIAKILEKKGFVEKVEKKKKKIKKIKSIGRKNQPKPIIEITLKYEKDIHAEGGKPAISGLKRISKPGQRIYTSWRKLKKVRGGYGMAIISTSKGLMTNNEAKQQKLGGEVICEIW
jgi:small subunit ribosomal protein S8